MVNTKNDNSDFPKLVLEYSICDVLELTETFLNENESLLVPGYKLYGNNQKRIHKNAVRRSGGVGVLIKREIVDSFSCEIINSDLKAFFGLF